LGTGRLNDWRAPIGAGWRTNGGQLVHRNRWITVEQHEAIAPTGAPADYGVVRFANHAIAVLPLHDDGSTVLVGQHRFPLANYAWEIPEGGGPKDEPPLDAARRELREETGLLAADWRLVLEAEMSNSVTDEIAFGFIALGLTSTDAAPDDTEALTLRRVPFAEALDLALNGVIRDVLTVAMLLRAYHMARESQLPPSLSARMLAR
jgi:8-oxo-dGTP pyrophosphatase MutT (NUDIX family)